MSPAGATRRAAVRTVLLDRRLSRALRGHATFKMGEHGGWLAILLFAYQSGGVSETGWVAALMLAPAAVLGPVVASPADLFPRHRVLTIVFAVSAATLVATGAAMLLDTPRWLVYGLAVLVSISLMPASPAVATVLPAAARTTDQLTAANVTVGIVETLGKLVGPGLAALILRFGSPGHVLVALGIVGLVGALSTIGAVAAGDATSRHVDDPARRSAMVELTEGFRLCRHDRQVRALVATICVVAVVEGALDVGISVLALEVLGRGQSSVSILGMALGLGAVFGASLSLGLVGRKRLASAVAVSAFALCTVFALLGASSSFLVTIVMLVAVGVGSILTEVGARTMLQGLAPDDTLARLFGVLEAVYAACLALGGLGLSLVATRINIAASFAIVSAGCALAVLLLLRRLLSIDARRRSIDPDLTMLARDSAIFGPLPPFAMEQILHGLQLESFEPNEPILRRGDKENRLFLVASGDVVVFPAGKPTQHFGRAAHIGEIAIMRSTTRSADVSAGSSGANVYWMNGDAFLDAVNRVPRSRSRAEAEVERRLAPPEP